MFVTNFFSENKNFKISNKKEIRALLKKICKKENKKISFIQIPEIISFVMDTIPIKTVKELGSILEADALGRESAINRMHQVNN